MATDDERIIYDAFKRHCEECHCADFEVCRDLQCQAARRIEVVHD